MTQDMSDILATVDRVSRIEPALRNALALTGQCVTTAIRDVFEALTLDGLDLSSDSAYAQWTELSAMHSASQDSLDQAARELGDNIAEQRRMDQEVEDQERREISLELYGRFETVKADLAIRFAQAEAARANFAREVVSIGRLLRLKAREETKDRERFEYLALLAQSALDCAQAHESLFKRVAVVKAAPMRLEDTLYQDHDH